mgnify:CR=1 FL=1
MKTEEKIIKLFIDKKAPRTIREIAQHINADYRITYTATQRLIEKNILLPTTVGKSTLCSFNHSFYGVEIYQAEEKRKESFLKNKDMKQLYVEVMGKLTSSLFIWLVFGSYAKGKQTKTSDIDIMCISNDEAFEEQMETLLLSLPLKTHLVVFNEEEFIRMNTSQKGNVVKEAVENNIVVYGIESYYRLKNVKR